MTASQKVHCTVYQHLKPFGQKVIGTKVNQKMYKAFMDAVHEAIERTNFSEQPVLGVAVIDCPEAIPFIESAGFGPYSPDPKDYVTRATPQCHVQSYLKRKFAAPVEHVMLVVYTVERFLTEFAQWPDECTDVKWSKCTHILMELTAYAGEVPQPSLYVHMIENVTFPTPFKAAWSVQEIRNSTLKAFEYANKWWPVAD